LIGVDVFSTNKLYCDLGVWNILCRTGRQHKYTIIYNETLQ